MTRGRMEEEEEHDDGEGSLQGASSWRSRWWLVNFFFFSLWGNDANESESVNKLNLLGGFGMIETSFDQSLFVYCWIKDSSPFKHFVRRNLFHFFAE